MKNFVEFSVLDSLGSIPKEEDKMIINVNQIVFIYERRRGEYPNTKCRYPDLYTAIRLPFEEFGTYYVDMTKQEVLEKIKAALEEK